MARRSLAGGALPHAATAGQHIGGGRGEEGVVGFRVKGLWVKGLQFGGPLVYVNHILSS